MDSKLIRAIWDPAFARYDFGANHPMTPLRLELTAALCSELGIFDRPGVLVEGAPVATDAELRTVHSADFVERVRSASLPGAEPDATVGLGTDDNPIFVEMHDASARIVGATLVCVEDLMAGRVQAAVNFCGGMHHAMPDRASGFCVYNDVAIGIGRMLELGAESVVYVDLDVHHGDGVEKVFWNDPRVTTISIHESGMTLFPGTGFASDLGGPAAPGTAINVSLPRGCGDGEWLRAINATVPALVRELRPDVLVTQHGCDTHLLDPLGHLAVSIEGQRSATLLMRRLADEVCGGRWLALGGGGYEAVAVVPRAWAHLVAIVAGEPIPTRTALPESWRLAVWERLGLETPPSMGDGNDVWFRPWEEGSNPEDSCDRAIMATRKAAFPLHGLDPWFD